MMLIFLSGCMLTVKLQSTPMHSRSDDTATEMQIGRSSRCEQLQANCNWGSFLLGTWAGLAVLTRQVPVDCRQPIWFQASTWEPLFALKQQTVDFYRNQDTPVYMCVLDAKNAFDRVKHSTLTKKRLDRNVPLHIVKMFIYWFWEQEFMVRWGNSLSMTFRCSNWIRQGGQLSLLLYNV